MRRSRRISNASARNSSRSIRTSMLSRRCTAWVIAGNRSAARSDLTDVAALQTPADCSVDARTAVGRLAVRAADGGVAAAGSGANTDRVGSGAGAQPQRAECGIAAGRDGAVRAPCANAYGRRRVRGRLVVAHAVY